MAEDKKKYVVKVKPKSEFSDKAEQYKKDLTNPDNRLQDAVNETKKQIDENPKNLDAKRKALLKSNADEQARFAFNNYVNKSRKKLQKEVNREEENKRNVSRAHVNNFISSSKEPNSKVQFARTEEMIPNFNKEIEVEDRFKDEGRNNLIATIQDLIDPFNNNRNTYQDSTKSTVGKVNESVEPATVSYPGKKKYHVMPSYISESEVNVLTSKMSPEEKADFLKAKEEERKWAEEHPNEHNEDYYKPHEVTASMSDKGKELQSQKLSTYDQDRQAVASTYKLSDEARNRLYETSDKVKEIRGNIADAQNKAVEGNYQTSLAKRGSDAADLLKTYLDKKASWDLQSPMLLSHIVRPKTIKEATTKQLRRGDIGNVSKELEEARNIIYKEYSDKVKDLHEKGYTYNEIKNLVPKKEFTQRLREAEKEIVDGQDLGKIQVLGIDNGTKGVLERIAKGEELESDTPVKELLDNARADLSGNPLYTVLLNEYNDIEKKMTNKSNIDAAKQARIDNQDIFDENKELSKLNTQLKNERDKKLESINRKAQGRHSEVVKQGDKYVVRIVGSDEGLSGTGKRTSYMGGWTTLEDPGEGKLGGKRVFRIYSAEGTAKNGFTDNRGIYKPLAEYTDDQIKEAGGLDNVLEAFGKKMASNLDQVTGRSNKKDRAVNTNAIDGIVKMFQSNKDVDDYLTSISTRPEAYAEEVGHLGLALVKDKDGNVRFRTTPKFNDILASGKYVDELFDGPEYLKRYKDLFDANMIQPDDEVILTGDEDVTAGKLETSRQIRLNRANKTWENALKEQDAINALKDKLVQLTIEEAPDEKIEKTLNKLLEMENNKTYDIVDVPEDKKDTMVGARDGKVVVKHDKRNRMNRYTITGKGGVQTTYVADKDGNYKPLKSQSRNFKAVDWDKMRLADRVRAFKDRMEVIATEVDQSNKEEVDSFIDECIKVGKIANENYTDTQLKNLANAALSYAKVGGKHDKVSSGNKKVTRKAQANARTSLARFADIVQGGSK